MSLEVGWLITNLQSPTSLFISFLNILTFINLFIYFFKSTYVPSTEFTFGKWSNIKMDSEIPSEKYLVPTSFEIGKYKVSLGILGTETSNLIPNIILASSLDNNSSAIISQVHLEYEKTNDKKKETTRLEIITNILQTYFKIMTIKPGSPGAKIVYQNAYFLGRHESKFSLLNILKQDYDNNGMLNSRKLALKFCGLNESVPSASTNVLPILIHSCPTDFSTVEYFDVSLLIEPFPWQNG